MIPNRDIKNPMELISLELDPWGVYRGEYVEIRQNGSSSAGMYQGMTVNNQLILRPHLEDKSLSPYQQERNRPNYTLNWNDKAFFVSPPVLCVMPREKSYLDKKIHDFSPELNQPEYHI